MGFMKLAGFLLVFLVAGAVFAQSTSKRKSGLPDPPKKDLPYLIHADLLVEPETNEAKEETRKDELIAWVPGAASPVKTPLAGPEFLFQSEKIPPDKLQLFRLEPKNGRREVVLARKKKAVTRPLRLSIFPVHTNLYRIRVDDSLAPGQYSLSPEGSNAVFCFAVE